jgi:hypothetical protein
MVDIICSPRRLKQTQHPSFHGGSQNQSQSQYGGKAVVLKNHYVREHFWSNDFIAQLQQQKLKRDSRVGISRTFEDLALA